MNIKQLASGSSGNAFIVERTNDKLLIDCGVLVKEPFDVLLITHLHSDHAKYLRKYAQTHFWTCGRKVFKEIRKTDMLGITRNFRRPTTLGIKLHEVEHDMVCYAAVVKDGDERYGHITDTNYVDLPNWFKNLTYYSIESNYDLVRLKKSNRPDFLIDRVIRNHMSNDEAYQMINDLKGENTKKINIIHVSKECNSDFDLDMTFSDLERVIR